MEKLKRRIHDFEKSHGRQLDLRRKFNNTLLRGGYEPTIDMRDFYVGIEIETCCDSIRFKELSKQLKHFLIDHDSSIDCKKESELAIEYILKYEDRHYFEDRDTIKADMRLIINSCVPCADNDHVESTCGLHVHLSHPLITKGKYPGFDEYFSIFWTNVLKKELEEMNFQLRKNNYFCAENGCYEIDCNQKYKQLNFIPSRNSDLWHFEFRGLGDGVEEGLNEIDRYIEALAEGYRKAFLNFFRNKSIPTTKQYWLKALTSLLSYRVELHVIIKLLNNAEKHGHPISMDEHLFPEKWYAYSQPILYFILAYSSYRDFQVEQLEDIFSRVKDWSKIRMVSDFYDAPHDLVKEHTEKDFKMPGGRSVSPLYWIRKKAGKKLFQEICPALTPSLKRNGYFKVFRGGPGGWQGWRWKPCKDKWVLNKWPWHNENEWYDTDND